MCGPLPATVCHQGVVSGHGDHLGYGGHSVWRRRPAQSEHSQAGHEQHRGHERQVGAPEL